MQNNLIRGQKIVIGKIDRDNPLKIEIVHDILGGNMDLDFYVFPVKDNILEEKNMVYFNKPSSEDKNIILREDYNKNKSVKSLFVNLKDLDKDYDKIILALSYYKEVLDINELDLKVEAIERILKSNVFSIEEKLNLENETFVIGEIYKYKDQWKFNTVTYETKEFVVEAVRNLNNIKIM
ncbi:TerD family protein [Anaeromicrobium sediminis]|uniref:TerD family protein n=1 Tax=Anaeromicrobium sediminis TaxID=1478221 RepID=UPI0015951C50|nr:TerD family protein [Anaeromicrobium sediminis]